MTYYGVSRLRVLIIDDAPIVRRMLGQIISTDSELEVVGTAANGRIAMSRIAALDPDVVIVDWQMPEMDGAETVRQLRQGWPHLHLIAFTAHPEDALAAEPAPDAVVTKPVAAGSMQAVIEHLRRELLPRVKDAKSGHAAQDNILAAITSTRPEAVLVACSDPSPATLGRMLCQLPTTFPVPIIAVQQMPAACQGMFVERLARLTRLPVRALANGDALLPGQVGIVTNDQAWMLVRMGKTVHLGGFPVPPEVGAPMTIDVLFNTAVDVWNGRSLALVLSGVGQDGLRGCQRLHQAGAEVVVATDGVNDPDSLPGLVWHAGLSRLRQGVDHLGEFLLGRLGMRVPAEAAAG